MNYDIIIESIHIKKDQVERLTPKRNIKMKVQRTRRNRGGCLCCRKRKIKCDERKPNCNKCEKGLFQCFWPKNGDESLSHNTDFKLIKIDGPIKFINMSPVIENKEINKRIIPIKNSKRKIQEVEDSDQINDNNFNNNNSNNNNSDKQSEHKRSRNANGLDMEDIIKLESFFDSYKVVQDFKNSGFTHEQSLLLMKYTYFILQQKLEWLNQTYAPKVEMENEAYLFEAAHSELLFETTNSREISLMNLTNAMIILKRGFNNLENETLAQIKLNDDIIKMELNLFKHENNLHQKTLNLKNSDLNSRILSDMVSVLKSEIETFRWQLTRAGILSIIIMTVLIMSVWNLTKKIAALSDEEYDRKGPLLPPVHQQTDEESHDYEADWDENVVV